MSEYRIQNMRFIRPSKVVAERHPDRWGTVKGTFFDVDGNKLTIASKEVTFDDALSAEFVISVENGTLTLPSGTRGRKSIASMAQSDIDAELTALREANSVKN